MAEASESEKHARELARLLAENTVVQTILLKAPELELGPHYLVAGCIAQTAWNVQNGYSAAANIQDYDLVYYDAGDTSYEAEDRVIQRARELFADVAPSDGPGRIEVRNEARVHLWYAHHFGHAIAPYRSVEHAIDTFPTTATSVGVRRGAAGDLVIYAPFGLGDLLSGVVRPNKRQVPRARYEAKAARWKSCWPHLRVVAWDDELA
jgi:uncharacterized protein